MTEKLLNRGREILKSMHLQENCMQKASLRNRGLTKMLPSAKPAFRIGNKKPDDSVSNHRALPLRARLEDSKKMYVKLPISLYKGGCGEKILVIDPARIHNYLDMPPEEVKKLAESFIYPKEKDIKGQNDIDKI